MAPKPEPLEVKVVNTVNVSTGVILFCLLVLMLWGVLEINYRLATIQRHMGVSTEVTTHSVTETMRPADRE